MARTVKIAARPVLHFNDYLMIIFILTTVLPAFLLKKQTIRVFNDEYLSIKQNKQQSKESANGDCSCFAPTNEVADTMGPEFPLPGHWAHAWTRRIMIGKKFLDPYGVYFMCKGSLAEKPHEGCELLWSNVSVLVLLRIILVNFYVMNICYDFICNDRHREWNDTMWKESKSLNLA